MAAKWTHTLWELVHAELFSTKMAKITLITGGQKSGKSRYSHNLALEKSENPLFVATARVWDEDFKERIDRHRKDRDPRFELCEEEIALNSIRMENRVVVIDCITLWLTNIFADSGFDKEETVQTAQSILNELFSKPCELIVVSNEVGLGIHPESKSGRQFCDIQGIINQIIATAANQVYLMVSGIPLKVK